MSYDKQFHEKYRLLLKFRRKFGTINIPSRPGKKWLANLNEDQVKDLQVTGRFIETLRLQYKKGALSKYKVDMLNHIGFEWVPKSHRINYLKWKESIDRLENFKQTYGHCNVPEKWDKDPELAAFVVSSRLCYKRGKLGDFKIKALTDIGFDWSPGKQERKRDERGRYVSVLKLKKP